MMIFPWLGALLMIIGSGVIGLGIVSKAGALIAIGSVVELMGLSVLMQPFFSGGELPLVPLLTGAIGGSTVLAGMIVLLKR